MPRDTNPTDINPLVTVENGMVVLTTTHHGFAGDCTRVCRFDPVTAADIASAMAEASRNA